LLLDAMSSFAGVPLDAPALRVPLLVSSANKCVQGVPGFGFVVLERALLAGAAGRARSVSLDLHAQWRGMEEGGGKWRFTSPTHALLACARALEELHAEGGVAARHARYRENQRVLVDGLRGLGFRTLLPDALQSPIITSFHDPTGAAYDFARFYAELKRRRFVIYPGKVSRAPTFRIGTIGHVFLDDVRALVAAVGATLDALGLASGA
jgi:2-aminoethylphosphonate-pyruvate transaminase